MITQVAQARIAHVPSRSGTRFPVQLPVELLLPGGRLRASTRNLSIGGVFVASPLVLAREMRMQLAFALPGAVEPLVVDGAVRWADPGGFGVRFIGLRVRDVWALGQYLESL